MSGAVVKMAVTRRVAGICEDTRRRSTFDRASKVENMAMIAGKLC